MLGTYRTVVTARAGVEHNNPTASARHSAPASTPSGAPPHPPETNLYANIIQPLPIESFQPKFHIAGSMTIKDPTTE